MHICVVIAAIVFIAVCITAGMTSAVSVKVDSDGETSLKTDLVIQGVADGNVPNPPAETDLPTGDTSADTAPQDNNVQNNAQNNAPQTDASTPSKDEIIALYTEAVNKVKPEATKIVRNFRNCRYDAEKSVLPAAVEKMGNPMMEKYIKDDTEPVEYFTKEEIIENFPVPKQEYSSKLTSADVTDATCTDNGTEYEITLYLADSTNPTAGVGVGAACHFMDVTSIASNEAAATMIKKFDAIYEGCVVKCKIDKATNCVTWANFYTPFTIDAIVSIVFSDLQTTVAMSYERDYTITY